MAAKALAAPSSSTAANGLTFLRLTGAAAQFHQPALGVVIHG